MLGATLEEAGGRLADMVTMTAFITDARLGDRFTELRKEIFRDDFPASALISRRSGWRGPETPWLRCRGSRWLSELQTRHFNSSSSPAEAERGNRSDKREFWVPAFAGKNDI